MYSNHAKATGFRLIPVIAGIFLLAAGCATLSPEQEQEEGSEITEITGIEAESREQGGTVEVQSSGDLDYTSVKQHDPTGVIFYFPQSRLGDVDTSHTPGKGVIRSIDLSSSEDQKNVRMEVRLARDLHYSDDKEDNEFRCCHPRP
ncbi:MAG: AMIN domain-containing protein [Desulfosalsimonas sp.]